MLPNMDVIILTSWTGFSSAAVSSVPSALPSEASPSSALSLESSVAVMLDVTRLAMSKPWSSIVSGYSESVFSSTLAM